MRTLAPESLLSYVLGKQHLAPGSAGEDVVPLAADLVGLHATSSLSPYLSAAARLDSFQLEDLDRELYERRSLLRLKCMRGTVFVVPRDLAPELFAATRAATVGLERRWWDLSGDDYLRWAPGVLAALAGRTASAAELRVELGADDRLRGVISMLCDEGQLLRDRPTGSRRSSAFRYRRFVDVFPDVDLSAVPPSQAVERLVRRYVAAYGPVSVHDIAWWSGLPLATVRPALDGLGDALVPVRVSGAPEELLMTADDAEAAPGATAEGSIALLPVLDPLLMGYRDRDRFLDPALRPFVYDPGGNATFTVLVDGRVAGVWDLTERPRPTARVLLFEPGSPYRRTVLDRCAAVGQCWFGARVPVLEYVSMTPLADGRSAITRSTARFPAEGWGGSATRCRRPAPGGLPRPAGRPGAGSPSPRRGGSPR